MRLISSLMLRMVRCFAYPLVVSSMGASILAVSIAGQRAPASHPEFDNACRGLHAGIRAEFVKRNPPYTRPSFVMVSLILLNDSDTPQDATPGLWKLVVDGKELDDSAVIFGNGPVPTGGWKTLNPGEAAELRKDLEADRYFAAARDYKLSWKGEGFQSPTITVTVPTSRD